jgi:hypothetical protein
MVVGPPHVDDLVEPALKLVLVIGDVRCEIGGLAILAHHHTVLFVTVITGFEPQGTVFFVNQPLFLEITISASTLPVS